jgi:hypothetical protein
MKVGRLLGKAARGTGKVARGASENTALGKIGMGALVGGAAIAGVVSGSGQVIDSAFDVAFDDPQADRAFLGTDLTPGYFASQPFGGAIAATGRAGMYANANEIAGGAGMAGIGAGIGAVGMAVGAGGLLKRSMKGSLVGGGIALAGAAISAAGGAGMTSGMREASARQNPYLNTSSATANRLSASGDIVLGAHNSRRGY